MMVITWTKGRLSLKGIEKQIYKEISRIAAELEVMPENKGMTRNELVAKAVDTYYGASEVAK